MFLDAHTPPWYLKASRPQVTQAFTFKYPENIRSPWVSVPIPQKTLLFKCNRVYRNVDKPAMVEATATVHQAGHRATGRQAVVRQAAGRQETGRQVTGRQVTGRQETGRQETGRQATGRQASGHQSSGHQATGRQASGHRASGVCSHHDHTGSSYRVQSHPSLRCSRCVRLNLVCSLPADRRSEIAGLRYRLVVTQIAEQRLLLQSAVMRLNHLQTAYSDLLKNHLSKNGLVPH